MATSQDAMNGIIMDKDKFIGNIVRLMGCSVPDCKVMDLINGKKALLTFDEFTAVSRVSNCIDFINYTPGYVFCSQLFRDINTELRSNGVWKLPESMIRDTVMLNSVGEKCQPMTEADLNNMFSLRGYPDDYSMLEVLAKCLIDTITILPFSKYSVATVSLGISYLLVHNGLGYCQFGPEKVSQIIEYTQQGELNKAMWYVHDKCFVLY